MKIQSCESSSEVVKQKVQAFWAEPLQKNELSFEALYLQPTVLNLINSLKQKMHISPITLAEDLSFLSSSLPPLWHDISLTANS